MKPYLLILLVVLVAIPANWAAEAESPRVVVLLNGSLVHGRVKRLADSIEVTNGPWYSVNVPNVDVDFIAKDLRAAYRVQLDRLRPDHVGDHVTLARWCLRHDLDDLAAERLLHLIKIAPQHASVRALEIQVHARAERAARMPVEVVPVSASEPIQAANPDEAEPTPSAEAVALFTRSVQPLLMNRCGQATCHGNAAKNDFHLWKLAPGGATRRELTFRNLRAAARFLNPAVPEQSPLVTYAFAIHGSASRAPLDPHDMRQRERLVEWVHIMAGRSTPAADPSALEATGDAAGAGSLPPDVLPAGLDATNLTPLERLQEATDPTSEQVPPAALAPPSVPDAGADPFDPAEFNQRVLGDSP